VKFDFRQPVDEGIHGLHGPTLATVRPNPACI
jgi:hypothetical protein